MNIAVFRQELHQSIEWRSIVRTSANSEVHGPFRGVFRQIQSEEDELNHTGMTENTRGRPASIRLIVDLLMVDLAFGLC
jgi:hypothetical protein